jgi:hypothetical protein
MRAAFLKLPTAGSPPINAALRVPPLLSPCCADVVEVAAGYYCTFARNASGELFAWGSNEFGGLNIGRFIDVFMPTQCSEPENAHYEQLAAGPDFLVGLQFPGLLGDARTRHLAKNAFQKWRRKAAARASMAVGPSEEPDLSGMLREIAAHEGLGGMDVDFGAMIATLLRNAESQAAEDVAVAAADAGPEAGEAGGPVAPASTTAPVRPASGAAAAATPAGLLPPPSGPAPATTAAAESRAPAASAGAGAGIDVEGNPLVGAFAAMAADVRRKSARLTAANAAAAAADETWDD